MYIISLVGAQAPIDSSSYDWRSKSHCASFDPPSINFSSQTITGYGSDVDRLPLAPAQSNLANNSTGERKIFEFCLTFDSDYHHIQLGRRCTP